MHVIFSRSTFKYILNDFLESNVNNLTFLCNEIFSIICNALKTL